MDLIQFRIKQLRQETKQKLSQMTTTLALLEIDFSFPTGYIEMVNPMVNAPNECNRMIGEKLLPEYVRLSQTLVTLDLIDPEDEEQIASKDD